MKKLSRSLPVAVAIMVTAKSAASMVCLDANSPHTLSADSSPWAIDCSILRTFGDVLSDSENVGWLNATSDGRPLFTVDLYLRDGVTDINSRLKKAGLSLEQAVAGIERPKPGNSCLPFVASGGVVEVRLVAPFSRPPLGATDAQILAGDFIGLATIRLDECEAP
jgi:hypothetical protein